MSADLPLCRWTAIKIHNIMGLVLCGALIPFSFGIQAITYAMSPKVPDKSGKLQVSLLYMRDNFPSSSNSVLFLDIILFIVTIVATIVVAVGVAPLNAAYVHSILGYITIFLMVLHIPLIIITRMKQDVKIWNDPMSREYQVHRLYFFNQFMIYVLCTYVLAPLGLLRTGYGIGVFFGYYSYLGFLHLCHYIYHLVGGATKSAVIMPAKDPDKLDLTPMSQMEQLEELEKKMNNVPASRRASQQSRRGSAAYRARSTSPSKAGTRRQSLNDHFKPNFVKDGHVDKEEKIQGRRESMRDKAEYKSQSNVFEQLGDHIKRRNSVSEGISAFFSDDAPKKVDLDFTKDRGSKYD